ncbi:enoyl-CoA hydratase/isomerase family protein [Galbitalea soli]|uniref:Enoyl-CoA hydratase/isomerase family protein n=1 Tax=Galbitalea soli TaxID=1268042 RepID=A0A7C9PMS1_9MICO|nr:enoyl-CoA hydratase/isomerase family protein [Galbitalea soli]NEM91112.1 enoyl-CoA hydratase/isomerase family protein [Galbitalea soli]NYJ29801.1 enoyl-CoA hydratase/carnithine racemase [Galbitalea soli]
MDSEDKIGLEVEEHGGTLIVRIRGGRHALLYPSMAVELATIVDRADKDPAVHAVVFTGVHPERFLSHADITWLQEGGVGFPPINTRVAALVFRSATAINKVPGLRSVLGKTKLRTLLQLDSLHATFIKMNRSGTIFIAALNGSALAIGAEFAWACDVRIMAEGDYSIGLSEVLLALTPGGGGSQRLTRLIGARHSLSAILEGKAFTPAEALAVGAVDEVVPRDHVLERAVERAEFLGLRAKKSLGAIKRSVYFGSTLPLLGGLQFEHAEFLVRDQDPEAQKRMLGYIDAIEASGDLPLLDSRIYARSVREGRIGNYS